MTYQPPPGLSKLQLEHERRQRVEPDHDDSPCVCCCVTCYPAVAARPEWFIEEVMNGDGGRADPGAKQV